MDFVACVIQIIKEYGKERVAQRSFIGLLEDYQAFENEATSFKLILKHWYENHKMEKISKMSAKKSQWKIDVSDIIHQTESEGFKEEVVSDLLHKLLLGMGIIDSKFDWDKEFLPKEMAKTDFFTNKIKIKLSKDKIPLAQSILNDWKGNGIMSKLLNISASEQWEKEVSVILQQTEAKGFDKLIASEMIRQILLGKSILSSSFDWDKEFLTQKTTEKPHFLNLQTSQTKRETKEKTYTKEKIDEEWEKLQRQQQKEKIKAEKAAKKAKIKQEKEQKKALLKSAISKSVTWLNDRRDTVCLILVALYFIGLIGLIITYFIGKKWEAFEWITAGSVIAFCICRFDVVLNKNHSKFWNWTWWICIAGGVLIGMLYETTGERTHKVVEKTEQNQPKKVRKKGNAKVKVSIVNAWLEHNVDNTLAIHCIFTVENAIGRTLDVVCTFQETGGRIRKKDLKDKNNEYCDFDGNVAVSYGSIFIEKEKQKMNLALYIPYPELHLTSSDIFWGKEVPHFINCLVKVIDTENESKTLDETNLHFAYWYGNSEDIN